LGAKGNTARTEKDRDGVSMKRVRWFTLCCISLLVYAGVALATDDVFDLKQVAQGVYAAIAKPAFRTNCNSAIVFLDDGVLVVDTQSKPSAAEALIAEIRKLTDKPVKYVVITHFHGDHSQGAQAYVKEWPAVEIVSTAATRDSIQQRGNARLQRDSVTVPQQIEKLKNDLHQATDPKQKAKIQNTLGQAEAYLAELKQIRIPLATLIVDQSLNLYRKSGVIEILSVGKAHTDGDLMVYLPAEKVLITGDVVHGAQPITKDGYFSDWTGAIDTAEKLDFESVIGGHGDVLHGKATFELWKQYFNDLLAEAAHSYAGGESLESTRKRVVPLLLTKYSGKFPERFSETVVSDVEKSYRFVSGATE
jgi:glyoxylase-like metal-dependent hydrolase (beta-lactamase superfamily II)